MEKYYVAALCAAENLGGQRVRQLVEKLGGAEKAWRAESSQIAHSGIPTNAVTSLLDFRQKYPDAVEKLAEFCTAKKIGLCSFFDENYPPILKEIPNPPAVFYYRGEIKASVERIAMVGTRHNTSYGERVALKIAGELAEAGLTVVSGAARGIDTFAHKGALKFGRTVAVLGYGINQIRERENKKLFDEIAERGLVMTEFSPNTAPAAFTFPPRNRIIAGLCRGVIVVEAGQKSGALITSDYAVEFNRDVFSVPGGVYSPASEGCNELIRNGAILIRSAQDILDEYNLNGKKNTTEKNIELEGVERKIFDLIPAGEFITLDEILNELDDIEVDEISQIILQLEQKKCIVEDAGRYTKA